MKQDLIEQAGKGIAFTRMNYRKVCQGLKTVTRRRIDGQDRYQHIIPGDILYLQEPLGKAGDGGIYVYAPRTPVYLPGGKPLRWRWRRAVLPGRFMPKACGRRFIRVVGNELTVLGDLDADEAGREGITPAEAEPYGGDRRRAFIMLWREIYGFYQPRQIVRRLEFELWERQ